MVSEACPSLPVESPPGTIVTSNKRTMLLGVIGSILLVGGTVALISQQGGTSNPAQPAVHLRPTSALAARSHVQNDDDSTDDDGNGGSYSPDGACAGKEQGWCANL